MAARNRTFGDNEDPAARRRRRRRRKYVRGTIRMLMWTVVLAGVFVLGLGYGIVTSDNKNLSGDEVTISKDRGALTATQPVKTVTVTKTVIKKVRVRAKPKT